MLDAGFSMLDFPRRAVLPIEDQASSIEQKHD